MFSRLEPILRPVIRRTESADTRMAIRRDESKDFGRSKGGQGADEYAPMEWEDMASVSTSALRIFLQTLLQGPTSPETAATLPPEESRTTPTTLGARATNAYQTMGRAGHDKNVVTETSPNLPPVDTGAQHPETAVLGHEFSDDDIRRVQFYIGELIELERRGVADLTIQRSLAFLDSLQQAIAEGKASLDGTDAQG
jgi:hypothetical protein